MLTEGEFKVIRALRTNTGDYTIGREKSLLVPTYANSMLNLNLGALSTKFNHIKHDCKVTSTENPTDKNIK